MIQLRPPAAPKAPGVDPVWHFRREGVRAGVSRWAQLTEEWLAWYGVPRERRERVSRCGTGMQVPVCKRCGVEDRESARRTADCEMRVCPRCGRQRAQKRREQIKAAAKRLEPYGNGKWHLHTIPVPRLLEEGTTIGRLKRDFETAWAAWRAAWSFLKAHGAQIAYVSAEVAPGGLVHVHAMAWHPFVAGGAFKTLRERVLRVLHKAGHGSQLESWRSMQYKVQPVSVEKQKGHRTLWGAIKEVAKYVTKGVAVEEHDRFQYGAPDSEPWQSHPGLCAQIEIAWKGRRVWRVYGELEQEKDIQAETWTCPNCGHHESSMRYEMPEESPDSDLAALVRSLSLAAASVICGERHRG